MKKETKIAELKRKAEVLEMRMLAFRANNQIGGFNAIVRKQEWTDQRVETIWREIDELNS